MPGLLRLFASHEVESTDMTLAVWDTSLSGNIQGSS